MDELINDPRLATLKGALEDDVLFKGGDRSSADLWEASQALKLALKSFDVVRANLRGDLIEEYDKVARIARQVAHKLYLRACIEASDAEYNEYSASEEDEG